MVNFCIVRNHFCRVCLRSYEKIVVFWTKEVALPHFNRYRVKFRKVYTGPLCGMMQQLVNQVYRKRKLPDKYLDK